MELTIEHALQKGIAAHKEGNFQEAERLYQAILQFQRLHPEANHNLGLIAVSTNKVDAALPLFKNALDANPKIEQFWLSYIDALIKEKQFENAEQAIQQGKQQGVAGEKLNALEAQLASIKKPGSVISTSPSQAQLSSLLEYYQTGQYGDAESSALSLTQEFPKHQFGWKVLGALFRRTGRVSESLVASQKSVQLMPQDAEAHNNLGATLQELGRFDEAEASHTQAIALKPDFAEAHSNVGNALQELGRLDEAKVSYTQAIVLKPDYAEAYSNLGNTLKELGRLEEAESSYTQAIALKPDYAEAHSNLGNTLKELGRLEEAELSYKQAIALKPDFNDAHYNLGVMLHELGRLDEAEASYTQAIALKPDFAEAHCNLGSMLKELGRLGEAEASYTQAIALKSDYAEAHYNFGVALRELGRLDEAEASYKQAITLKPDFGEATHMLAALSGDTTATAPRDYIEGLFDNYAAKFESSLVDNLEYKIPRVIAEMIIKDSEFDLLGSIVDLGCGTGLFGMEIKQFCEHLEGIDLSEKMLDKATEKNIYNKLIKQDIVDYLSNESLNFDYFISTDVFIYIGDLSDVFRLIKSRNKTGGKLAFSTEDYDGGGFFLEQSGRYSHSKKYIDGLCEKFGYKLRHFETQPLRKDKNQYISGGLYLLDF
jgi:tetratricopeptide (TPR) repeat protein